MGTPQKLKCSVSSVIDHGDHVYTLALVPQPPPAPRFKAGQFIHLALDPYDPTGFWPESRVFSIASSPQERGKLQVTYSVRGKYTERMEKELVAGGDVWVKMPYGDFIIDSKGPVVLFAGGTGITAFAAFLSGMPFGPHCPVTLFFGARQRRLLCYQSLVEKCRQNVKGFKAYYFLDSEEQLTENEIRGLISIDHAWRLISDPLHAKYYLSGPPPMISVLSTQLREMGITGSSILVDAWE